MRFAAQPLPDPRRICRRKLQNRPVVAAVAIPQCVIFLAIFAAAKFIFPLTTPDMIADFKACGGFLLLATGFRIAKIHNFPVADMIPAMVLVMPVSWFWGNVVVPML